MFFYCMLTRYNDILDISALEFIELLINLNDLALDFGLNIFNN